MGTRTAVGGMCVVLLLAMPASAFDRTDALRDMRSNDVKIQEQAANDILKNRQSMIAALMAIVESTPKDVEGPERNAAVNAIYVLGAMRAIEAVEVLVEYIDFARRSEQPAVDVIPAPGNIFPAVRALIEIGKPSIPAVLNALAAGRAQEKRFLFLARWIVYRIERGRDAAVFRLESDLEKSQSVQRSAAIQKLLEYTKEIWSKRQ